MTKEDSEAIQEIEGEDASADAEEDSSHRDSGGSRGNVYEV